MLDSCEPARDCATRASAMPTANRIIRMSSLLVGSCRGRPFRSTPLDRLQADLVGRFHRYVVSTTLSRQTLTPPRRCPDWVSRLSLTSLGLSTGGSERRMRVSVGVALVAVVAVVAVAVPLVVRSRKLHSAFEREVRQAIAGAPATSGSATPIVSEADLAPLPQPVRRYLRRVGVLNRPRVRNFRAEFIAEMRSTPTAPWMRARAEQYEFFGPASRFFFMRASRSGVPFVVFHRYAGGAATMEVRIAGLIPAVQLSGAEMTKSETVTLFNDICLLAPAALLDAPVTWVDLGDHQVQGTFSNAGFTVTAVLTFDAEGDLVDFRSEDRSMAEGNTMRRLPWTTPVSEYGDFGGIHLGKRAEARFTDGGVTWAYGRFVLERIAYNVSSADTW
jgi:hypothetical protein